MPKKTTIIVHHTASHWCDAAEVDRWHKANGWSGIGYHYLINNGYPKYSDYQRGARKADWDGKIEKGRTPDTSVGAHCLDGGHNVKGIGVSLVGQFDVTTPTANQMASLVKLLAELCVKHGIDPDHIYYHSDFANKSCPGKRFIARSKLRQMVKDTLKPKVQEPPLLILNGAIVEGAYLTLNSETKSLEWNGPEGSFAVILGGTTHDPKRIVKASDILKRWGWTNAKYTSRLSTDSRAYIRAVRNVLP